MNIAFCINRLALISLGPTLTSLIRNCSNQSRLNLYILCAQLNNGDKKKIEELIKEEQFTGNLTLIDFEPEKEFKIFRSLHGDWTPYGRLLLPELVDKNIILYLDSDLIIELDILQIELNGNLLAAVKSGPIKNTLESTFYIHKMGLSGEENSFNSGVLYMNLSEWRKQKTKSTCLEIGRKYPMDLLSCDQSILNALFAGKFVKLPLSFNCVWSADQPKPMVANKMILHFVGSPKPWDLFASFLHKGYNTWRVYLPTYWHKSFNKLNLLKLRRAWKIRRLYIRTLLK